jgi:hypothetical protein
MPGETFEAVTLFADISGFALLALWPIPPGADAAAETRRVLHCCTAIQQALHDHAVTEDIRLSLKLAVGVGEVRTTILGGVFDRWEFLVTGPRSIACAACSSTRRVTTPRSRTARAWPSPAGSRRACSSSGRR